MFGKNNVPPAMTDKHRCRWAPQANIVQFYDLFWYYAFIGYYAKSDRYKTIVTGTIPIEQYVQM